MFQSQLSKKSTKIVKSVLISLTFLVSIKSFTSTLVPLSVKGWK